MATEPVPAAEAATFPKSAWLWLALPIAFGGCATFELTDELYREARRSARLLGQDGKDTESEPEEDPWASVGEEARSLRPVVKENEDWWSKYVMSEKARQIERNLGVE